MMGALSECNPVAPKSETATSMVFFATSLPPICPTSSNVLEQVVSAVERVFVEYKEAFGYGEEETLELV